MLQIYFAVHLLAMDSIVTTNYITLPYKIAYLDSKIVTATMHDCNHNLQRFASWLRTVQQSALNLPAQLENSKQNCLHCDTTSIEVGTTTVTHENILLSGSQARLLQSAV